MKWLDDFRERHSGGRWAERFEKIRPYLPPINFITVHYAYFIFSCLFFALVFWGCGSSSTLKISFLDSLFMMTSALTSTGLNTHNLSQMSLGQQIVLFLAMLLGHPILVSLWTVLFRRHVFEKRFRAIVKKERERKLKAGSTVWLYSGFSDLLALARLKSLSKSKSKSNENQQLPGLGSRIRPNQSSTGGVSAAEGRMNERDVEEGLAPIPESRLPNSPGGRSVVIVEPPRPAPTAPAAPPAKATTGLNQDRTTEVRNFLQEKRKNVGRNGEFFNLTLKEREYLGGVEYRAIEVLVVTVALYYVLWQALGAVALGAWLAVNAPDIPAANQQNAWWTGIFLAVSAFSNSGMSLLDAGMSVFQTGYYFVVLVVAVLMLVGSQASPIFLRAIIWVCSRLLKFLTDNPNYEVWKETFEFILHYPRRVYINMFPAQPTISLGLWLGAFLLVDWIMFFLLNIGNKALEEIPTGPRVLDGLFQSVSILSTGFSIVSVSAVYFGLQVLWLIKMYASAYPTSITVRGSNVYEERSLGIYAGDEPEEAHDDDNEVKKEEKKEKAQRQPQSPRSFASQASRFSRLSTASKGGIDKIVGIGRESGQFLGRQLKRRMTEFQGVGVAPKQRPRRQKRFNINSTQNSAQPTPYIQTSGGGSSSSSTASTQAPDLMAHHVRSQLSHDVWWVALAFFLVTVIETAHTLEDPAAYSLFNILFEIVSAYANNGVSVGLPRVSHAFSGGWRPGSKLVLILVMLRGRHRDLPVALDRAVKLPSMDLDDKEEDDAEIRRTISRTPYLGQASPQIYSPGRSGMIRPFAPV
ncbi:cation transport protein-domain-containing protein [Corynascus novoguineensis]|uniref:Cation transport protein-domain-containing protein n=1 Tax=Corynascus novoguineensis TaxID=1126955 RepID=A0AAN7CRF3_9PEZI|nr:cation transport protein-domain-containing protein [Corynascus novoguineensis]